MLIPEATVAQLSVLSVGDGDMKFSFDNKDPQETARAKRCIADMLKRGYSIFVEVDGKLTPCKGFDPETCEYIIADNALYGGEQVDEPAEPKGRGRPKGVSPGVKRVPASKHKATAVARTAGG